MNMFLAKTGGSVSHSELEEILKNKCEPQRWCSAVCNRGTKCCPKKHDDDVRTKN